jgi:superfamily II DNA helicase RecQ
MAIACFWIPAKDPADAQDELNKFLASHRVLAMDRHFVANGNESAWGVAVDYADAGRASQTSGGPDKSRVDYREVLDPATFAVFAALRTRRKELAEQEGVPAYVIVTNEQMAQIARMRAASMDELKQVAGLGENRLRRYGRALLETIASAKAAAPEEGSGQPDEA